MRRSFLCIIAVPFLTTFVIAQQKGAASGVPRDTSFTVNNTATKVLKQYPHARVVAARVPAGVVALENVIYAKDGDRELHLDLFSPVKKSAKGYPGMILIHGGGWRSGYRQMEWPTAQHLAARGYVAATVEYRLSMEALYPAGIHDLKAAIRWMRANAAKHNIDSTKIAAYGCSAGGELAAFLRTTGDIKKFAIYAEVHTIPDMPHPFWLFHPWFDEAFGHILKFLDKTLKDK